MVRVPNESTDLELLRRSDYFVRRNVEIHPALIADVMLELGMAADLIALMRAEPLARRHVHEVAGALAIAPGSQWASDELLVLVSRMVSVANALEAHDAAMRSLREVLGEGIADHV